MIQLVAKALDRKTFFAEDDSILTVDHKDPQIDYVCYYFLSIWILSNWPLKLFPTFFY